ncbi:MAG: hypothetical protein KN64_08645 [Sulfurovum sp. AS07-7]|nr:MAG: hypothetical protein KN64_08645 [Sulfurovum sp. AS07-7]
MIRSIKHFLRENRFLKNIYKTCFDKNLLISYTVLPFLTNKNSHTNVQESRIIANIFKELEFNIDIIHYTNKKEIDYKKYDVIFGFGEPFENSFVQKDLKRIYYATGAHVCHQNYAEIKRVEKVNNKYNANILPKRLVPWNWSLSTSLSDSLIVIGNYWTKSTYEKYTTKPIYLLNATALINENSQNIVRDIKKTKKNFLWFGSSGLVHKGLDLCLEYFSEHSELILHICGPMEDDFKKVFGKYFEKENIFYYGFTNVNSQKFIDIVSQCSFGILPTCSEGQATALLTSMGAGLIPIATKQSGIDIEKLGFLLNDLDLDSIDKIVQKIMTLENLEIETNSKKLIKYIKNNHSLVSFGENLKVLAYKVLNV